MIGMQFLGKHFRLLWEQTVKEAHFCRAAQDCKAILPLMRLRILPQSIHHLIYEKKRTKVLYG